VETTALVAEAGSAGAELAEVLGRLWDGLVVELEHNLAERLAVGRDVEEAVGHDVWRCVFVIVRK